MAILIDNQTKQRCMLRANHSFGRFQSSVNTYIPEDYISKIHALIEWSKGRWILRDISSNGLWLNGHKLAHDQIVELHCADEISFASKSGYSYKVLNLNPPCDYLLPIEHDNEIVELDNFHVLASEQSQNIILTYNHQTCTWWQEILSDDCEQYQSQIELKDKDTVIFNDLKWQLQINRIVTDTQILRPSISSLDELNFLFQTSLDEESTHIFIESYDEKIDLFVRSHHYLTLALARKRAEDLHVGLSESEQGWLYSDMLAHDLGVELSHLNIQIYRIRKQFSEVLNSNCESNDIIERNAGKIRLASKYFCIIKGDKVECDTRQITKNKLNNVNQNTDEKADLMAFK